MTRYHVAAPRTKLCTTCIGTGWEKIPCLTRICPYCSGCGLVPSCKYFLRVLPRIKWVAA